MSVTPTGVSVLVNHPCFGSVWLDDARLLSVSDGKTYVEGWTWDDSDAGSPYMPDDYTGERVLMNFPATCIRKKTGEVPLREP